MKTTVVQRMIAAACAVSAALCLWQSSGAQEATGARPPAEAQRARAKELFDQRCARCHGRDGRGQTKLGEIVEAPDFTDADWWKDGATDARLRASIHGGKGQMPAFGKKLTRSEISSLIAYVRGFAPGGGDKR